MSFSDRSSEIGASGAKDAEFEGTEGHAAESPTIETPASEAPTAEFVQLFTRNQRRIYLYILTLLPNPVDAEEVLQDTNLVIWGKLAQFRPDSNFQAWAFQIAYYEVRKFRERKHRDKVLFSDELIETLAAEVVSQGEAFEQRRAALLECLNHLRTADQELIQQRYRPGMNGKNLADFLGRPANSVYQSLGRIRKMLLDCVNRRMTAEARS